MKLEWKLDDILDGLSWDEAVAKTEDIIAGYATLEDPSPNMEGRSFQSINEHDDKALEWMNRLATYSELRHEADLSSEEATSQVSRAESLGIKLADARRPFNHWIAGRAEPVLDDDNAARLVAAVPEYADALDHKRQEAKHLLSQEEERIVDINDATRGSALVNVRGRLDSDIRFKVKDKWWKLRGEKGVEKTATIAARNPSRRLRRAAYKAMLEGFEKEGKIRFDIYNGIVREYGELAELRGFPSPISVRNAENQISDATTQLMLDSVKRNVDVFHDFFRWKAEKMGVKRLRREDIYAPVNKKPIMMPLEEVLPKVFEAFGKFSPRMRKFAEAIIDENHMDSHVRPNKAPGGFCALVGPGATPYVLMNYLDHLESVSTTGHELGHGVHFSYASDLPFSLQHPPTPMCEIGSTFGEMLLFDSLLEELSPEEQRTLIENKIGQSYATIPRQAYFTLFEIQAHKMISEGATLGEVSDMSLELLRELHGDAVEVPNHFRHEWLYIPHFVESPFYCLAYAMAEPVALSCYQEWKDNPATKDDVESILAAGGSRYPVHILREKGMDLETAAFWDRGHKPIRALLDKLVA